ncbi:hypothetical protein [Polaromonas sp.]|uniref:hypothetical protein n=1 Tax=Polaromonas sp. TaxID=1869339 RepID=UPI00248A4614|nr:hypothetical protein [Polaromonas sp.]MDI1271957.1 hypothetical protein [Polaromonas sp.]
MSQARTDFGGALASVLEQVACSTTPRVSVADACTPESFIASWSQTLSEHAKDLRKRGTPLQAPVVVVHIESTGEFSDQYRNWIHRRMLGASHLDKYAGVLAVGTASIGCYTYPAVLQDMSSCEDELRAHNIQSSPTVVLASDTKLLIWPQGIDSEYSPIEIPLSDNVAPVNLTTIDDALSQFYKLVAQQNTKWWKDRTLRTTVEQPEATVQGDLWIYLTGTFAAVALVRLEEVSGNGRRDITVYPTVKGPDAQGAVLELKTLRDVRTPVKNPASTPIKISLQENIDWACSGVQQSAAYRDSEKLDGAFLCLYDFCAGNIMDVENAVAPHASLYEVIPRRYWITASHEEYRKHFFPLNTAASDKPI